MPKTLNFSRRIGNVFLPLADAVTPEGSSDAELAAQDAPPVIGPVPAPFPPPIKVCRLAPREGCFRLAFLPIGASPIFGPRRVGTVRIENLRGGGIRFSGDLYKGGSVVVGPIGGTIGLPLTRMDRLRMSAAEDESSDAPGTIPIFARKDYISYLKGTIAKLVFKQSVFLPCRFSMTFEEFRYNHPATGFSGSFPNTPTRTVRFDIDNVISPESFSGKLFEGATELGSMSLAWVSPFFRRAKLVVHKLQGAEEPMAVGTSDFPTVFATAGWDLTVQRAGQVPLPASLVGVQNPTQCWSQPASATLMESVPGYNPADLDTVWRAHLLAVPAKLGCSRGRMFDSGSGNPNNIAREGALTHSHDGYPVGDSTHFGAAANGLQKDFPRGFLRSASHEVGHTFNQIHQELEGGSDNSIMTTTPSVADVLFAAGQSFPNDINLGFNARVRRHLIHLPDPGVRPGAMEFFGAAVNAPEADQIFWPDQLSVQLQLQDEELTLGEPLSLSWSLTNNGNTPFPAPSKVDCNSLTTRISVTDPYGRVTFIRPALQEVCSHNPLQELAPGASVSGSDSAFWGRDGFAFERPGRHTVEVIVLWQVGSGYVGATAETDIWVSFPVTEKENRVAALLLDHEVGRAIACKTLDGAERAKARIAEAGKLQPTHPACAKLKKMGMFK